LNIIHSTKERLQGLSITYPEKDEQTSKGWTKAPRLLVTYPPKYGIMASEDVLGDEGSTFGFVMKDGRLVSLRIFVRLLC
jgi:hypothetical protein